MPRFFFNEEYTMKTFRTGIIILLITFLTACASTKIVAPDWVTNSPGEENGKMVFVASGSSSTGNLVEAERNALTDLNSQIQNYIGVKITATTTAVAKGTLEGLSKEIEQIVQAKNSSRVSGFTLGERFVAHSDSATFVYLKGLYNKAEIEKEKSRIQAIFREQDTAIAGPEAEGDSLLGSGAAYKAFEKYIQAASASSSADVENADIKFERNMNKARDILSKITLIPLNGDQRTAVGVDFENPFSVKVVWGSEASSPAVPEVTLRFNYKIKRGNNLTSASAQVKTGADGIANFTYPTPNFAGAENVVVLMDVNPYIESLSKVPRKFLPQVNALEELAAKNRASLGFMIESAAKTIPMAIFLVDADDTGTLLRRSETQAGIQQVLNGFKILALSGARAESIQGDDAEVLKLLKPLAGASKRVIFGRVDVTELVQESGGFTARASGTVKCLDIASGQVIFTSTKNKRARGTSRDSAMTAAFRQLGEDFGKALADQLP